MIVNITYTYPCGASKMVSAKYMFSIKITPFQDTGGSCPNHKTQCAEYLNPNYHSPV